MSAHTPGPWNYEMEDADTARVFSEDYGGVVQIHQAAYDPRDVEADASLIAAAPDLLEAAKGDHDQECRMVTALRQAQFALEDMGAPAGIVAETRRAADEAELGQIRRNRRAAIAKAEGGS